MIEDRHRTTASAREEEDARVETSTERFDRMAFARRALDLVRPSRTRIVLCEGTTRLRVESGPQWGRGPGARWAMVFIPRAASRRAIALALTELAGDLEPWTLDVLLREAICADAA